MAIVHGRHGVIYLGATTAVAVANTRGQNRNTGADMADATVQGDAFRRSVPGTMDFSLSLDTVYDDTYHTLVDAAINSTELKMYDYPDRRNSANYFYGTVFVSMDNFNSTIGDVVTQAFTVVPASSITFKHS